MNTIFMNSGNSKTCKPHKLSPNLLDKINLKRGDKYVPLSNFSLSCTWANKKKSFINNKVKISAPVWQEEFELTDESYSV